MLPLRLLKVSELKRNSNRDNDSTSHTMDQSAPASKKLAERKKIWTKRSKTGCLTCRSRRLKCDEDKPFCKRCVLSNIECKGCGYGMIIAASPTAPHLDATADVRDLLYLAPQMPSHVRYTFVTNPENTMAEFIPSTGEQLLLYLKFLPCGLGHSSSLDSTIACLASALRDSRLPEHSRSDVQTLTRYNQALRDLQSSLNDPEESLAAETLCATQLLGIYESLVNGSNQPSSNHLRGTVQLYRFRGPERFSTDFERALLINLAQLILTQSGFRGNTCFLEPRAWMDALKAAAGPHLNQFHGSDLQVSRYEFMIPFGRIVGVCNSLILQLIPLDEVEELRSSVLRDISWMRMQIEEWYRRWQEILEPSAGHDGVLTLGRGDNAKARRYSAIPALYFKVLYHRFHIALGGKGSYELEDFTKPLATQLDEMSHGVKFAFGPMFAGVVSRAFLNTTEEWQLDIQSHHRRLIRPDLWTRWLAMCGIYAGVSDEG